MGRLSLWEDCTSLPCPRKQRDMPTRSFLGRAKIHGPSSCETLGRVIQPSDITHTREPCWGFHQFVVTSSSGACIWCQILSSFLAAALMCATFAIKRHFFAVESLFIHRRWMQHWQKSIVCPDATSIFSTTICSAIPVLPQHSLTECAAWAVCGKLRERSIQSWHPDWLKKRPPVDCAASLWALRPPT